ncbi:hypothetical protein BM221_005758 [Beauveria bassiana]|uniref:Uncharacterized protein n=1 Tax=Beauveria bassiana TaxID=176275 RepID=A0A2N6NPH0_BEABA|nr:hypothetical protein BM221_005758 [Beauveria bassiana]
MPALTRVYSLLIGGNILLEDFSDGSSSACPKHRGFRGCETVIVSFALLIHLPSDGCARNSFLVHSLCPSRAVNAGWKSASETLARMNFITAYKQHESALRP